MESVLIAALIAAASHAGTDRNNDGPAPLDLGCFQLMAELADAEDPRLRSLARNAAQYFLGRIDAAAPGFDPVAAPAAPGHDRESLLARCGERLESEGRSLDFSGHRPPSPDA